MSQGNPIVGNVSLHEDNEEYPRNIKDLKTNESNYIQNSFLSNYKDQKKTVESLQEHAKEIHVFLCEMNDIEVGDFDNMPINELID